eukprot:CAMPEP_0117016332 /NCGR_PEP_ID=MMETSP0472-20121206/12889_1 /TAXON_ID=693140 ORGANISM="Tiarina fusus, Strain LIS" /NCGR_SAMPLE_ID=MMETSP0472 /ASSEMBLY_ACC=CAM_ASM_000603 /LENGTH=184 /DNA_ID=CAMNT_0004720349 /DNA_START=46 /DNA_END=600 /DNA_ORIENTATION=-
MSATTTTSDVVYSQLGMEEGAVTLGGGSSSNKRGHSCCGCCCDMRRAVIIVNAIMMAVMLLAIIGLVIGVEFLEITAANADDDQVKQMGEQVASLPLGFLIVRNVLLAVLFAVGIPGAVKYNAGMVQVACVGYAIKLVFDIQEGAIVDIIMDGFFVYPHFYFLKEMKENIMTPDNYPKEAQCCC